MKKILCAILLLGGMQGAQAQNELFVGGPGTVTMTGASTLTLKDAKLTNNGSFVSNNGTVILSGSASSANSSVGGTGNTAFSNLTINKTANSVLLNQDISVSGNLSLTSGGVELSNGDIDFGSTGSLLNETTVNRIFGIGGELIATANLNAPNATNPAGLGVQISSLQNLGSTTIRRGHAFYNVSQNGISRYYDVAPSNNTGLNATLRFAYFDSELNGNNEISMLLWKSDNGGSSWVQQNGATTRDVTSNYLELGGLGTLTRFTAANPGALCTPPVVTITGATSGCGSVTLTASGGDSYAWSGGNAMGSSVNAFNASGYYTVIVSNASNCTATASVNITVTAPATNTTTATACDSYIWNGVTYTSTGSYSVTNACVTDVLNVTITPSTSNTTNVTACDSYTWSMNGQTYTSSGTYSIVNGCGTQSLALIINTTVQASITAGNGLSFCPGSSTNLIAMPAGGGFAWNTGASTQTITVNSSGTFTVTVTDANSCTSVASVATTVSDTQAPVVSCPSAQNLTGTGSALLPDYRSMVTATDNCAANVILTQMPAAGTAYTSNSVVNVTITANDGNGNSSTCGFSVNVTVTPGQAYTPGGDMPCNFRYLWPTSGAVVSSSNASISCYSIFGSNIGSTSNGEPTDCGTAGNIGVWYFFRMPGCGAAGASPLGVKISTNNAGTMLSGTNVAVYSVTNANSCAGAGFASIACSTNSTVPGCNGTTGSGAHGTLEFGPGAPDGPLQDGGSYFIYVSGDNGLRGNFELTFEYVQRSNITVTAGPSQTRAVVSVPNNGQSSFTPQWRPFGATGWAVGVATVGNTYTLPTNSLMPGVTYEFRALYACATAYNYIRASNVVNYATTPNVATCGPVTGLTCNAVAGNVTTTWNAAPAGTAGNLSVIARSGSTQLCGTVVPNTATSVTFACAGCTATNTNFTLQSICGGANYISTGNCAVSAAGQALAVQTVSFEHNGIIYENIDFNDPQWGLFGAEPTGDFVMSVANGQLIISNANASSAVGFDFELRPSVATDFTNVVISSGQAVDAQLSISDMNGSLLHSQTLKQAQNGTVVTLETSNLAAGLYIVSVRTEEGNVAKKLIKIN